MARLTRQLSFQHLADLMDDFDSVWADEPSEANDRVDERASASNHHGGD